MNPRHRKKTEADTAPPQDKSEDKDSKQEQGKRKSVSHKRSVIRKILKVLSLLVVVLLIAWISFVACTRWLIVSDAKDIQGTWIIAGSEREVPITDSTITLTDDVAYNYTLDEASKTIEVKLGTMSGKSHYVFSLNRKQIVLIDGDMDAFVSTITDFQDLISSIASGTISAQSAGYKNFDGDKTIIRLNKIG